MAVGMQLSVICAEDAPRISAEEAKREAEGTLFGPHVMRMQREACAFWPRGSVDASFYEPVQSSIPTLIMSGEIDPVTPPVWGDAIAKTLPNSKHIVMPGTGHTAGGTGCGRRLIKAFIDAGTVQNLDTSCVDKQTRPPYFVTPGRSRSRPPPRLRSASPLSGEGPPMIRVENLHKRFGEVRAVDGVSFTAARRRRSPALLGPNGAGKTTTLRMLYTLMRPDEGTHARRRHRRRRRSAGRALRARRAAGSVGPVSAAHGARAHRVFRRAAGHHRRRPAPAHRSSC